MYFYVYQNNGRLKIMAEHAITNAISHFATESAFEAMIGRKILKALNFICLKNIVNHLNC